MIYNLQVLRGMAALAIVFFHTGFTFSNGVHTEFLAVSIFFVISGFIMTYITREKPDAGQFITQRLIKIVPLYWICTIAILLMGFLHKEGITWGNSSIENIIKNFFFVPYRTSRGDFLPFLSVGWTLVLEMYFYFLFAVMLVIDSRKAPLFTCLSLIGIEFLIDLMNCSHVACEVYSLGVIHQFIYGVLIYYIWKILSQHAQYHTKAIEIMVGLTFVIFIIFNLNPSIASSAQKIFSFNIRVVLLPSLLVLSVLLAHSANLSLRWKPLLILGDASYALYLTHTLVIALMQKMFGSQINLDPVDNEFILLAILSICIIFAFWTHKYLESPLIKMLKKKFSKNSRYFPNPFHQNPLK